MLHGTAKNAQHSALWCWLWSKNAFMWLKSMACWLAHLEFDPGDPGWFPRCATIPLGSNLGQVVYSHCLHIFSAARNWSTKRKFYRLG